MSRSSRSVPWCRASPSCGRSSARCSGSARRGPPSLGRPGGRGALGYRGALMGATVTVRVPASSANLGPGFDSFAVALGLYLELEVSEADRFELVSELDVRRDRTNLAVAAFERLRPATHHRFEVRSEIPLSGGLGSSAAAIVAGLLAADRLSGGGAPLLALATEIEGH